MFKQAYAHDPGNPSNPNIHAPQESALQGMNIFIIVMIVIIAGLIFLRNRLKTSSAASHKHQVKKTEDIDGPEGYNM